MKFSRATTYGLRALGNLLSAGADDISRVKSLQLIAREEKISLKFLERLFSQLRKAGIVASVRGANGGYYLQRGAEKISLLDVLRALGEDLAVFDCLADTAGRVKCRHSENCGAVPVLQRVQGAINQTLGEMRLRDLIESVEEF